MKRTYRKGSLVDMRKAGRIAFMLFVVFVAYRILTPPTEELARTASPDGTRTARLRRTYYAGPWPSYKVYYRETGRQAWLGLHSLPTYTNAPPDAPAELLWSPDSSRLELSINRTSVWHHVFKE